MKPESKRKILVADILLPDADSTLLDSFDSNRR